MALYKYKIISIKVMKRNKKKERRILILELLAKSDSSSSSSDHSISLHRVLSLRLKALKPKIGTRSKKY